MDKNVVRRMSDGARRDIEMMLWGAVAFTANREAIVAAVTPDLVSAETWKLFDELSTQRKKQAMSPELKEWLGDRAVTIQRGDDLLSAIVRALVSERDVNSIQSMATSLTAAMKYGDRDRVVTLLKDVLVRLGELTPEPAKALANE